MTVTKLQLTSHTQNTFKRSISKWFHLLKATLILTIFAIKEVVFVHKFFLHTFFRSSISDVPAPIKLKIGYGNKLQFKLIVLLRFLLKDQFWGQQWYKRVHNSILKNIQQQNLDRSQLKMPIPTVKLGEISPQEFWQKYVKTSTPVIIKGGAKDSYAYENWTPEMFGDRCGDLPVLISDRSEIESFMGTLKEVVDSKGTERRLYVSFCANIFGDRPELHEELDYQKFRDYMGGKNSRVFGAQLFLGVHPTTGTGPHCAVNSNLFFQIYGKKKWTFVHPDYLWLMYPMLDRSFQFCASFIKNEYDEQYLQQYAPLQQYCPKYEAILEPGDILFNPVWQWHAVENVTDETLAAATRWVLRGTKRTNTFFDLIQLFSPVMWQMRFGVLSKQIEGLDVLVQKTTQVVKAESDFVAMGKEDKMKAMKFHEWPEDYQF